MRPVLPSIALALLVACGTPKPVAGPPARAAHAVGVVTVDLEDTTRGVAPNGSAPAQPTRKLTSEIWYPAAGEPTLEETFAADLDPAGKPYPLVVFVHGSGGVRRQSTFLATALAAHGYVVVSADLPLTYLAQPGGSSDLHSDEQVADVRFLAEQVELMSTELTHPLHGAIDLARGYAVSGHSTGGTVALAAAFAGDAHDDRLKAAVALAPCACFFREGFFTSRALPLLVIAGTNDRLVPPSTNGRRAFDLALAPKAFASLVGGNHLYFTDIPLADPDATPTTTEDDIARAFARYGGGTTPCTPFPPVGTEPPLPIDSQHRLTVALTAAFLDAHLRGLPGDFEALRNKTDPLLRLDVR
jgi:predicted dienelactone hydrolase